MLFKVPYLCITHHLNSWMKTKISGTNCKGIFSFTSEGSPLHQKLRAAAGQACTSQGTHKIACI